MTWITPLLAWMSTAVTLELPLRVTAPPLTAMATFWPCTVLHVTPEPIGDTKERYPAPHDGNEPVVSRRALEAAFLRAVAIETVKFFERTR